MGAGRDTERQKLFLVSMKQRHEICGLKRVLCCTKVVKLRIRVNLRRPGHSSVLRGSGFEGHLLSADKFIEAGVAEGTLEL